MEPADAIPQSLLADNPDGNRDLGWMLYDIDYNENHTPMFFRARLNKAVLRIPDSGSPEVRR
jgi:CRISPR-associated protein Cas5d